MLLVALLRAVPLGAGRLENSLKLCCCCCCCCCSCIDWRASHDVGVVETTSKARFRLDDESLELICLCARRLTTIRSCAQTFPHAVAFSSQAQYHDLCISSLCFVNFGHSLPMTVSAELCLRCRNHLFMRVAGMAVSAVMIWHNYLPDCRCCEGSSVLRVTVVELLCCRPSSVRFQVTEALICSFPA